MRENEGPLRAPKQAASVEAQGLGCLRVSAEGGRQVLTRPSLSHGALTRNDARGRVCALRRHAAGGRR